MSETHFDRSDWRPGKRRRTQPRVKCYGGQKVAPVGLVAARKFVGLNTNAAKKCKRIAVSTGRAVPAPGDARLGLLPVARRSGGGEANSALCPDAAGAAGEAQKGAGEGRRVSLPPFNRKRKSTIGPDAFRRLLKGAP